jgi:hypothetical protein
VKLSFKLEERIKVFHDKQKLKLYIYDQQPTTAEDSTKNSTPTEDENKQNLDRTGSIKPQEKKRQVIRQ